jgi:hypothetical protein
MQQQGNELHSQATSRLIRGGLHVRAVLGDVDAFDWTFVVVAVFCLPAGVKQ